MSSPFFSKDVIDKAQDIFTVPVIILHGDIDNDFILFTINLDNGRINSRTVFVQEFYERDQPAFIAVYFLFSVTAFIRQGNMQSLIEEGQFPQTCFKRIKIIDRIREYLLIRFKCDVGTCFFTGAQGTHFHQRLVGHATLKGNSIQISIPFDFHAGPFTQCIDNTDADTMKPTGNRITVSAKFATGMEHSQNDFDSRFPHFMHSNGNTTAIVNDADAIVFPDFHFDMCAITGQCFINTIIYHFIYEMVQSTQTRTANIHTRPFAYGFQPFQDLDLFRTILYFFVFRHAMLLLFCPTVMTQDL